MSESTAYSQKCVSPAAALFPVAPFIHVKNKTNYECYRLSFHRNDCCNCLGFIDQLECLELPPYSSADVLDIVESAQEPLQLQKFGVVLIVKPRFNGDAIIDLISKGMRPANNAFLA